jgi:hypothetical protein
LDPIGLPGYRLFWYDGSDIRERSGGLRG